MKKLFLILLVIISCEEADIQVNSIHYRFTEFEFDGTALLLDEVKASGTMIMSEAYSDTLGITGFDAWAERTSSGAKVFFETEYEDKNSNYILIERSINKGEFIPIVEINTECPNGCIYEYVDII
jgi:hypothetical protein